MTRAFGVRYAASPQMDIVSLYRHDPAPALQRLICVPALDRPMEAFAMAGEGWALALVAIGIAWTTTGSWRRTVRSALRYLVILALVGAIVAVTKRLFHAPRPLQLLGPEGVRVLLQPLRQMSFPSGHAAAAAALAVWASFESRRVRWGAWLLAFLCGLARVYVGAHWVTDVCAGWLLGVAVAVVVSLAWSGRHAKNAGLVAVGGTSSEK